MNRYEIYFIEKMISLITRKPIFGIVKDCKKLIKLSKPYYKLYRETREDYIHNEIISLNVPFEELDTWLKERYNKFESRKLKLVNSIINNVELLNIKYGFQFSVYASFGEYCELLLTCDGTTILYIPIN